MARNPNRYVFRSTWHVDADADRVYAALVDVESYPLWWPQVRAVRQLDESSGELTCRSMLPYDLSFVVRREIEDPVVRILRATMTGDLAGTSQWTVQADGSGTVAVFDEDVVVRRGLIKVAGRVARPALTFNHGLMMRSGEKGLRSTSPGSAHDGPMGPYGVSAELTAAIALGVLALIMRWVFHRPRRVIGRPVDAAESAELGLLSVVVSGLSRHDAMQRRAVLGGAGIRSSMSRRRDGTMDVLVFTGDVGRARVLLES